MRIKSNKGFTLIELLIVVAIIGIIAAIAIPGLMRARMAGNESSAIGSMRSISSGESTFESSCGGGGYATTLAQLAVGADATVGFVSPDLDPAKNPGTGGAAVDKSGYHVLLAVGTNATEITAADLTCNAIAPAAASYFAEAWPIDVDGTGRRSFFTDQRGTVFFEPDGVRITADDLLASTKVLE